MLRKIPTLLLALSLCSMSGCGTPIKFQKKDYHGVYRNPQAAVGFALGEDFKNWEIREGVPNSLVACLSPLESPKDPYRESMLINLAPDTFASAVQELQTQMPGFQLVEQQENATPPSVTFTFAYSRGNQTLKARSYFLKTEKSPITVTFTSTEQDYSRWSPRFDALLASVRTREADFPQDDGTQGAATATATPAASPAVTSPATASPAVASPAVTSPAAASSATATPTATP